MDSLYYTYKMGVIVPIIPILNWHKTIHAFGKRY